MAQMIRLRNDSPVAQVVYLRDGPTRVVPRGTILVKPNSYALKIRHFTRVGTEGEPDQPVQDTRSLQDQIAQLQRELAEARASARPESEAVAYPAHQGGGKWLLSNGEVTKGGLSREAAQELEDAVEG